MLRQEYIYNLTKEITVKYTKFVLIASALLGLTALPASAGDEHLIVPMDGKAVAEIHHGKGTINSVDAKTGKINLSHEQIPSLHWAAMTMDFEVQDKALLNKLKKGQKVSFSLIEVSKGKYVINAITVVK